MARFLLRLDEVLPDREHPLVGGPTVNAALIAGGSAPNVVPDRCEVDIDRRIVPGETDPAEVLAPFERLAADLRSVHPEVDITCEIREWTGAAEAPGDPRSPRLARVAGAAELGENPPDVGFTGITDARFYINEAAIPTVIFGPGSSSVAHTANEWVAVDDLVAAARIYARAVRRVPRRTRLAAILVGWTRGPPTSSPSPTEPPRRRVSWPRATAVRTRRFGFECLAGGCSGFTYELSFVEEATDDDAVVLSTDGFRVLIDPASQPIVRGSTLDFDGALMGGGLKMHNPQAKHNCACGDSFNI